MSSTPFLEIIQNSLNTLLQLLPFVPLWKKKNLLKITLIEYILWYKYKVSKTPLQDQIPKRSKASSTKKNYI